MATVQEPVPNYVLTVGFSVIGSLDNAGEEVSSMLRDSISFEVKESDITPYEDLTEELVISWVKNSLGPDVVANYEESLAGQVWDMINPPVNPEPTPLPWS